MRSAFLAVLIVVLAACGGTGASVAPTASGTPTDAPNESPDFGAIEHPTGPTDVVLRFEEGGGFVMPAFLATQAPIFTLYGDGTIIFRNPALDPLEPIGSVYPMRPFRTARLTEEQIQEVLASALGEGGLGVARPDYPNDQISDASTAVFTIDAGGLKKTVSIYALGLELEGMPDGPVRAAFAKLASQLGNIDDSGAFATAEYAPELYRGVLLVSQPGAPDARPWPWTEIAPADFVSNADPNAFQLPARVMSVEEVEALGIDPLQGGFQGLTLIGPNDGKVYSFSLRPLLPDELA
ncbi:MAG: hypothetical protein Q7S35_08330 [Candidatus Limnocylindrales bacterium]|nr:hypothetical protein [Candidatus Limnocylindrales bacterium]